MRSSSARPIDETSLGVSAIAPPVFQFRVPGFRVLSLKITRDAKLETRKLSLLVQLQQSRCIFAHDFSFRLNTEILARENHVGDARKGCVPMRIIGRKDDAVDADAFDHLAQACLV